MGPSTLDPVEKFLAHVSMFTDQSLLDLSSVFPDGESLAVTNASSPAIPSPSTTFMVTIKEWLLANEQQTFNQHSTTSQSKERITDRALHLTSNLRASLEKVIDGKDHLRRQLRQPSDRDTLPLQYDDHRAFLEMVEILGKIGERCDDYESPACATDALPEAINRLDQFIEKTHQLRDVLRNLASDVEGVRKQS